MRGRPGSRTGGGRRRARSWGRRPRSLMRGHEGGTRESRDGTQGYGSQHPAVVGELGYRYKWLAGKAGQITAIVTTERPISLLCATVQFGTISFAKDDARWRSFHLWLAAVSDSHERRRHTQRESPGATMKRTTLMRMAELSLAGMMLGACGNYSNEDLLFMSAAPTSTQLAVVFPTAPPTVTQAQLAQDTHNGVSNVDAMLDDVLGLVDAIRSNEPSGRTDNSRTWGPFPDTHHPGWQWQMIVTREADGTTFDYQLNVANVGTPNTWIEFLTGTFDASQGVEQGNGRVMANFTNLSNVNFPIDANAQRLETLAISFQNFRQTGSPVSVTLTLTQMPDANGITSATFSYVILADKSGQMTFTLVGNIVPGPSVETVTIGAGWLSTGAGEATLTIVAGDDAGLSQTECWDTSFEATYNSEPWSTADNLGDPSSCPTLPTF